MTDAELATAAAMRLRERWKGFAPTTFIGLGSGLGDACRGMETVDEVAFEELPGFAAPTVAGHSGRLTIGTWAGENVLVMLGRMHLYEGHSLDRVVHPIRVAKDVGVRQIVLTNMSGGMHADWKLPALALIDGHRDLQYGWREGFRSEVARPYSEALNQRLQESATAAGVELHRGVYAGLLGPNYETPSEIRALRNLGCDLVGMSTVQEARVAAELDMEVCAVSCVANHAAGVTNKEIDHGDVVDAGKEVAPKLIAMLEQFLQRTRNQP
jgi:purine-nucleoside phosphorylase